MNNGLWRKITPGMMTLLIGLNSSPAWSQVDPFEAMFNRAACPGDQLANYAVLRSTSADVLLQIQTYAAAPPGESGAADAIVNRIRQNLVRSIQAIKKVDKAQVIVWTVPDVTLTPYALRHDAIEEREGLLC